MCNLFILFSLFLNLLLCTDNQKYFICDKASKLNCTGQDRNIEKEIDSLYMLTIYDIRNCKKLQNCDFKISLEYLQNSYKPLFYSESELLRKTINSKDSANDRHSVYMESLQQHLLFLNEIRYQLYPSFLNIKIPSYFKRFNLPEIGSVVNELSKTETIDFSSISDPDMIKKIQYLEKVGDNYKKYIISCDSLVKYKEEFINNMYAEIEQKIKTKMDTAAFKLFIQIKSTYMKFIENESYIWSIAPYILSGSEVDLIDLKYNTPHF